MRTFKDLNEEEKEMLLHRKLDLINLKLYGLPFIILGFLLLFSGLTLLILFEKFITMVGGTYLLVFGLLCLLIVIVKFINIHKFMFLIYGFEDSGEVYDISMEDIRNLRRRYIRIDKNGSRQKK